MEPSPRASGAACTHLLLTRYLLLCGQVLHFSSRCQVRVLGETPHVQAGCLTTADLSPVTGRRHQLRVHVANLGHPILGDDLYCDASRVGRGLPLFLQSVEVRVRHPSGTGWVNASVEEATRFERRRERARAGWDFETRQRLDLGT